MAFGRIDFLLGLSAILLGLAVAFPTTDLSAGSFTTNNTSESSLLSPGADNEYYAVSGDGQYVEQVNSPYAKFPPSPFLMKASKPLVRI